MLSSAQMSPRRVTGSCSQRNRVDDELQTRKHNVAYDLFTPRLQLRQDSTQLNSIIAQPG